jgi:Ni/Fe-hydrogenase subunit HybB-like protein
MAWSNRAAPKELPYAEQVERDLLFTLEPLGTRGRTWITALLCVCGFALFAYITQLVNGLRETGMRDFVSWGVYMTNFIFFIGISHAGTLISAILRVTNAEWRRPITRMAEAITVFALIVGASMVIIDMGRPDRLLNVIRYGRFQSPILWDLCSITTYLTGSFLYLYVAMIPDMSIVAENAQKRGRPDWLVRFYRTLSLGYKNTPEQERRLNRALGAMAVIIIPVAVSVHTVVSWVFGMTLRPGWHSTIFGPYFVIGAIFSGTAAIITAMELFRRAYHLEKYLTLDHFRKLATLLVALTLLYTYFTLSEYLTTWYGGAAVETRLLSLLMGGTPYGTAFWFWVVTGLFVPLGLLVMPSKRSLGAILTASVLINIGMWLKRYLILVPTLETPFIPPNAQLHYHPSWVEFAITAGAFAGFMLLFTLFSRVFPIVSIWETAEDAPEAEKIAAKAVLTRVARPAFARLRTLILVGSLSTLLGVGAAARLRAQQTPPLQGAHVDLVKEVIAGEQRLVATVTVAGQPLKGARVAFSVQRAFSPLTLGEDTTLADGRASVAIDSSLPAGATGKLAVVATIVSPDKFADVQGEATVTGGQVIAADAGVPRALWSSRAPLLIVGTIAFLATIVWTTYSFVVRQLVMIKREASAGLMLRGAPLPRRDMAR